MKLYRKCAIVLFTVLLLINTCTIHAASASSLKNDNGVKTICKYVNNYIAIISSDKKAGKLQTIKMSTGTMVDIVGTYISVYENLINWNDRISANDRIYCALKNTKTLQKRVYNIFGKTLKLSTFKSARFSVKRGGKLYLMGGEWGDSWPTYKIMKVTKVSGKYKVTFSNRFTDSEGRSWTKGTTYITLKKSSKSAYGYNVTKIQYKLK